MLFMFNVHIGWWYRMFFTFSTWSQKSFSLGCCSYFHFSVIFSTWSQTGSSLGCCSCSMFRWWYRMIFTFSTWSQTSSSFGCCSCCGNSLDPPPPSSPVLIYTMYLYLTTQALLWVNLMKLVKRVSFFYQPHSCSCSCQNLV